MSRILNWLRSVYDQLDKLEVQSELRKISNGGIHPYLSTMMSQRWQSRIGAIRISSWH